MSDVAATSAAGTTSRRVKKVATRIALVAIASIGAMGFLHTKWGKPLLMKIGGCPVANITPADAEKARNNVLASHVDTATTAPRTRFALGFQLDTTTLADVEKWADGKGLSCDATRGDTVYACENVPTSALLAQDGGRAQITELSFGFRDSDKTLYTVSAWRERVSTDIGASDLEAVAKNLHDTLGDPTKSRGEHNKEYFEQAGMPTSVVEYDLQGYKATVSASRLPDGVWLREVYFSPKIVTKTQGT